ncbi:MAG: type I secretion system permease/ATPase, partial [Gammaproteobacteria bacterium]|nr:type I secretion system permease/ATPase [Gammaproteobacteria bacterium]
MPRLNGPPRSVLREVLAQSRRSFVFAGFFSLLINVLLLVPSMYMLAIYGRVLTSGSEST